MRVLHLSTFDINGGAARAAYRQHKGLQSIGVDSRMLVQHKSSDDPSVFGPKTRVGRELARLRYLADRAPHLFSAGHADDRFSSQWLPDNIVQRIDQFDPDIINLHWIGDQFMQIETIGEIKRPMVLTLHDMWAFTGGCHYSDACNRYEHGCGACPILGGGREGDLSRWIWKRKAKSWNRADLTIVVLNNWMAACVRSSELFKNRRIEIIPNGLDTSRYKSADRSFAREWLGLPQSKRLVLFGSLTNTDPRKGFQLLQPALKLLSQTAWRDKIEIVIFGSAASDAETDLGFPAHSMGRLHDDSALALVYSAGDVFVSSSTQDNLPNTVMEAMACGVPCVAFDIGGLPDMVTHQRNGYLVRPFDVDDLAEGITWVLENQERHKLLSQEARKKATTEYAQQVQAQRYRDLYATCLGHSV